MRARMLIILCVAMLYAPWLRGQVRETVLLDNFADNSSGWTEGSVMYDYIASIHSGKYWLEYQKTLGSHVFDIPIRMDLRQNYFIESVVQISDVGKIKGAALGIVWGKGPGGYLAFAVTEDGRFFVREVAGRKAEYILGPTDSKYIYRSKPNKLRVQYSQSGRLSFFINGKYVAHAPAPKCHGQNTGIVLYGRQRSEVSSFGAYGSRNYDVLPGYAARLKIPYYEIEDGVDQAGQHLGNGDCKVQPGETIQLAVYVRNTGAGPCKDLLAKFHAISDFVTVLGQDAEQRISNLGRQQGQWLSLRFAVRNTCSLDKLNFKMDVTSSDGLLAETVPLSVPLFTKIAPINKDNEGKITITLNLREENTDDINTFFPITLQNSRNCAAVVVGVESYSHLPKAMYATNDAKVVSQYFLKVMNMMKASVISVSNQNATKERLVNILKPYGELQGKGKANVIFYFSGLAMCGPGHAEPYIMLSNSSASDPKGTGLSVKEIVKSLQSAVAGNVICIFETSFAGLDRTGKPIPGLEAPNSYSALPSVGDSRTCLLYASSGKAHNPVMEKSSHGMFTHFLLSALQEFAKNRDALDMKTLFDYINRGMDQEATRKSLFGLLPRMDCLNKDGIKILK